MSLELEGVFQRLADAYEVASMKELSEHLGYKKDWASQQKRRGNMPYDAIIKTANEKGLTLDYLIYGNGGQLSEEQKELRFKQDALDLLYPLFNDDKDMPNLTAEQALKVADVLSKKFGGK